MKPAFKILYRCLVKRFYKEQAGLFVFVFAMMFMIVNKVDGAGLYEYHYSLVTGMLNSNIILLMVFFLWFLYVRKFTVFVSNFISSPHFSFLHIFNQLNKAHRFRLFFYIESLLLLPIIIYTVFIFHVGLQQHLYLPLLLCAGYLLLLCCVAAARHVYQLDFINKPSRAIRISNKPKRFLFTSYPFILLRFVFKQQINIWAGIQLFTCGMLYLIARNNNATDRDLSLSYLFYSLGILANGILIFRIRTFEETHLSFYKSLPVFLVKRLAQYMLLYFLLLTPECVTAYALTAVHLTNYDAFHFMATAFALVLLMHSITLLKNFSLKDYTAILLTVFFIEYILLIVLAPVYMYGICFSIAVLLFCKRYYTFESPLKN